MDNKDCINRKLTEDFDSMVYTPTFSHPSFNLRLLDYRMERLKSPDKGPEAKLGFVFPTRGMYDVLFGNPYQ